jgi:apolipoprotein N-acyltransferase
MPLSSARLINLILSAASGVLFALAFPDYGIAWLAFLSLAPLLIAIVRSGSWREAALHGWLAMMIAWLMMVPWVVRVMSHYGGLPYITGVLIFCAMCAILGLYGSAFALIVWSLRLRERFAPWLLIAPAWAAIEFVRTYLLTGFPWNLIGTAIVEYTPLIQISRAAGPYFLGCLVVLPSIVIAWLVTQRPRGIGRVIVVGGTCIVLFVWWATGYVASQWRRMDSNAPTQTAALLQPNISQEMRWNVANVVALFQRMMAMTNEAANHGVNVIIWPESTVPLSFASTEFFRNAIESTSATRNVDIILGSVAEDPSQPNRMWNAAFLVSGGRTIGHYDKIRLVPFGEYVPMRKMLFFAEKLVHAVGEFEFGTKDHPLRGRFAYGPAICYEVVFPRITATQVKNGAEVLVTITNDAWYDGTSAPRQHLNQVRLRAVEADRWVLRAGTTGISAVIDPTGRIVQEIPMGKEGIIYAKFAARRMMTPYVRWGDWFAWLCVITVIIAFIARRRIEVRGSKFE